jgi:hypothetical protein
MAKAWKGASENPNRLFLVWLHSLNLSPWYLWLEGLFQVLQSPLRPKNLLVAGTLSGLPNNLKNQPDFSKVLPRVLVPLRVETDPAEDAQAKSTYVVLPPDYLSNDPSQIDKQLKDDLEMAVNLNNELHLNISDFNRRKKLGLISLKALKAVGCWPSAQWISDNDGHKYLKSGLEHLIQLL